MATTPSGTTAATEAHHDVGFPPFDPTTYPSQLLWLAITFGALYFLMSRVALPRVSSILEARRERISADLAEAQRLKDETDAAIAAYEKALAEARAKAQAIATETRERVNAEADANRKAIEASLNERLAAAEAQIAQTKASALSNVRGIATDTATALVEHLIGTAPAADEVERAVDGALSR